MKSVKIDDESQDMLFFLAIKQGKAHVVYESEKFRLSEIDLINLIKICLIDERSKIVGRKLLEVYKDSTEHRYEITQKRLERIGIKENGTNKPTQTTNTKSV